LIQKGDWCGSADGAHCPIENQRRAWSPDLPLRGSQTDNVDSHDGCVFTLDRGRL